MTDSRFVCFIHSCGSRQPLWSYQQPPVLNVISEWMSVDAIRGCLAHTAWRAWLPFQMLFLLPSRCTVLCTTKPDFQFLKLLLEVVRGNVDLNCRDLHNHQAFLVFHSSNFKEVPTPRLLQWKPDVWRNTPPHKGSGREQCQVAGFPEWQQAPLGQWVRDKTSGGLQEVSQANVPCSLTWRSCCHFRVWAGQGAGWVFFKGLPAQPHLYSGGAWPLKALDSSRASTTHAEMEPRRNLERGRWLHSGKLHFSCGYRFCKHGTNSLWELQRKIFMLFWLDCQLTIQTLAILNTVWGLTLLDKVQYNIDENPIKLKIRQF